MIFSQAPGSPGIEHSGERGLQAGHFQFYDIDAISPHIAAGYSILTPTARLARRIKTEWDQRQVAAGNRSWTPVRVAALEPWLMSEYQRAATNKQLNYRAPLDTARAHELWLQVIAADVDNREAFSLLQPASAAQLAAVAREDLLRWRLDLSSNPIAGLFHYDEDCAGFLRWLTEFNRQLSECGLDTTAGCITRLLQVKHDTDERVVLMGFDDIPPLYRECVIHLSLEQEEVPVPGEPAQLEVKSYNDRLAELGGIAQWTARQYRSDDECTIGIILNDMHQDRGPLEHLLRREFDSLGEDYGSLPVNFSTGITLDQAPVVASALTMLTCGTPQISLSDAVTLSQSRYSRHSDRYSEPVMTLLRRLHRDGRDPVSVSRLRYLARGGEGEENGTQLGQSLGRLAELRLHQSRLAPSAWTDRLCEALDAWGWPGEGPLDSLEYQQVERWYEALDAFAGYDQVVGELDFQGALAMLRRCCAARISQPQTPDSRIQVLGPLEAAGLRFDKLWVSGLEAGRFPAPARPNPFIPVSLQREHDMPHASVDREWRFARVLFEQFARGADTFTGSYARYTDGTPNLPSPLLSNDAHQQEVSDWLPPANWKSTPNGNALESVDDTRAPALSAQDRETLSGGSGVLEDQSQCAFRATARRRLGLEPLDEPVSGLSAADRGNLVHNALYVFWERVADSAALSALSEQEKSAILVECIESAVDRLPSARRALAGGACLDLERRRLLTVLLNWLVIEEQRDAFSVAAREEAISVAPGGLPLEVRVDRIDQLDNGARLLIDYKTGSAKSSSWYGDRPKAPQLPLYAVSTDVNALAFANVRSLQRDPGFDGVGNAAGITGVSNEFSKAMINASGAEDWDQLLSQWRETTDRLATEFIAGHAEVDPLKDACRYCGLQSLCRVGIVEGSRE